MSALYDVDPGDETRGSRGDLCDRCAFDLVVEGEDYCKNCIGDIEVELKHLEYMRQVKELTDELMAPTRRKK